MPNNNLISELEKKKEEYEQAQKLKKLVEKRKQERKESREGVCYVLGLGLIIISVLIMFYANAHAMLLWGEYEDCSLGNAYTQSLPYAITGAIVCAIGLLLFTVSMENILVTVGAAFVGPIPVFIVVLIITWILILALLFIEEIIALFIKSHPISKFLRTVFL